VNRTHEDAMDHSEVPSPGRPEEDVRTEESVLRDCGHGAVAEEASGRIEWLRLVNRALS
jgi:hypothetical protein